MAYPGSAIKSGAHNVSTLLLANGLVLSVRIFSDYSLDVCDGLAYQTNDYNVVFDSTDDSSCQIL